MPTNEVIRAHYKEIPGGTTLFDTSGNFKPAAKLSSTVKAQLQSWLTDYVISSSENAFTDYPYVGSSCKGEFVTKTLTTKMQIMDDGSALSIKLVGSDKTVPVSSKYSYFPFAFSDGCIQFIDGLLK